MQGVKRKQKYVVVANLDVASAMILEIKAHTQFPESVLELDFKLAIITSGPAAM